MNKYEYSMALLKNFDIAGAYLYQEDDDYKMALDRLQELVDKATPKKAKETDGSLGICPVCEM